MNESWGESSSEPVHVGGHFVVSEFVGGAADFHAREIPDDARAHLWWFDPVEPALILGSSQSETIVDSERCRERGIVLVRRRSGGGLVLVTRSATLWFDLVVPRGHVLWDDDIARSSYWIGEAVQDALADIGIDSTHQHRAGLVPSEWGNLVCFASRGPGEIFFEDGSKVLGISQRRTRRACRFQCAVSLAWESRTLIELLADTRPTSIDIEGSGATLDVDPIRLRHAITRRILDRPKS